MTSEREVQLVDTTFRFHDANGGEASAWVKTDYGYGHHVGVDPFPAYPHDEDVVRETLYKVKAEFPLPEPFSPWVFLTRHEFLSRTNAQEGEDSDYDWEPPEDDPKDDRNQRPWRSHIVLSAKRIPPHPATTRYLVAHEYGHAVETWLLRERGERIYSTSLLTEYADLRGLAPSDYQINAGGGTWHRAIQEVFANDFRIMRPRVEREYWPHPGIARPEEVAALYDFWKFAR